MKARVSLYRPVGLLTVLLAGAVPSAAQDDEKKPDRLLRLLPVGEAPPYVEKIINGVRVEQEAPEGAIPPRQVVMLSAQDGQERGNPVRLRLDQLSAPLAVGPGIIPLHETGASGVNSNPWHKVKASRATHSLAFLWRDPQEKKWTKARSLTLADDIRAFPAGRVRFVNVSPYTVGFQFNGKNIKLPPYKNVMQAHTGSVPLTVALQGKGGTWHKVFDSVLTQTATERTNVVIYRADG
nr:hypothetical protein [Akkermansiaceae bacterium]